MIEYGITTSEAHIWAHVCPKDVSIYWYPRKLMAERIDRFPEREIKSARGRLVKLNGNRFCDGGFIHEIDPPLEWWRDYPFFTCQTDNEAGAMAEQLFERCVKSMLFGAPCESKRYTTTNDQYRGMDFCLTPYRAPLDVEVKADIEGGEWGTGNLFVQTHEYKHKHGERHAHRAASTPG